MKLIRTLFIVITVCLGFNSSMQLVQAANLGGPNVEDYVYEDNEYITNQQYDQLAKINQQIDIGKNPQKLYIIVLKDGTSVKNFYDVVGQGAKIKGIEADVVEHTGEVLYGHDKYYEMDSNAYGATDFENNYLICNLKDNRLYFNPSDQASGYLTDLKFWKIKRGLSAKLTSGSADSRMVAVLELADRLTPELKKVAQTPGMLHSITWFEVKRNVETTLFFIGVILFILFLLWIHHKNKNKPHHGDPNIGNSSYDEGFDEGYYMGSQDPFL